MQASIYQIDIINKHKIVLSLQCTISDRIRYKRKLNIEQVKFCLSDK